LMGRYDRGHSTCSEI